VQGIIAFRVASLTLCGGARVGTGRCVHCMRCGTGYHSQYCVLVLLPTLCGGACLVGTGRCVRCTGLQNELHRTLHIDLPEVPQLKAVLAAAQVWLKRGPKCRWVYCTDPVYVGKQYTQSTVHNRTMYSVPPGVPSDVPPAVPSGVPPSVPLPCPLVHPWCTL